MKLIKLKKISDSIFEMTYINGWLFKKEKTVNVYHWVFGWRFTETGKDIPYRFGTSLSTIATTLRIGETFYSNPKTDRINFNEIIENDKRKKDS